MSTVLTDIANRIAKVHILQHNATFEIYPISLENQAYYMVVTHPSLTSSIEEAISTKNIHDDIAAEYVHCRVHGMAAKLISKLFAIK
jgi:hypothetical protein